MTEVTPDRKRYKSWFLGELEMLPHVNHEKTRERLNRARRAIVSRSSHQQQEAICAFILGCQRAAMELQTLGNMRGGHATSADVDTAAEYVQEIIMREFEKNFGHCMIASVDAP